MKKITKPKLGFTLAEVLITLSIIGVVAALTIPGLMKNYQNRQYVSGLQKAYSELNQAFQQMAADAECPGDLGCAFDYGMDYNNGFAYRVDEATDRTKMGDKIASYFHIAKNCKLTQTGCFPQYIANNYDGTNISQNVGSYAGDQINSDYRFITADGISFKISAPYRECSGLGFGFCFGINGGEGITIDVNGLRKPNIFGRDIFCLRNIKKTKFLMPMQSPYDFPCYNVDAVSKEGTACADYIINNSWQMTY